MCPSPRVERPAPPTPASPSEAPHAGDRIPTVLVVDDREADQDLHCLLLHRWGLRAIAASDGREALAYTRAVRPDAVVTDLRMPHLDGWGLLAHLRAAPETAGIPVLVVTAHEVDAPTERARTAGAAAVLLKPLDVRAFREALTRALASADPDARGPTP